MAVDTPAKIAVLGAGPIGLETALYARFLGYDVEIFERGQICENVRRWGHVRLFTPFEMNSTTLGIAAIQAHDESYHPPQPDALLTGREWFEQYLQPLAETDLIQDHLRLERTVVAIARDEFLKHEKVNDEERGDTNFRILAVDRHGAESETIADVVIDATGVFNQPNWLGIGGGPAIGERSVRDHIRYDLPDMAGLDRLRYADRRVLVIGSGYSAATNVVALLKLAETAPSTRITWVTRQPTSETSPGPLAEIPDDPLAERVQLTRAANQAAADPSDRVLHLPGTTVKSLSRDAERNVFHVEFSGTHEGQAEFDEVIANVGFRPDRSLYEELQVHECYATSGPMKLAAKLAGSPTADCLQQTSHGAASLVNPEPHFYILGAKSYARNSSFLLSIGYAQIRDLFTLIGDRIQLDLYEGAKKLVAE